VAVWLMVVIVCLAIIQLYVLPFGWWPSVLYCLIFILSPLIWVLIKLPKSFTSKDFTGLSFWIKVAMLRWYFIYVIFLLLILIFMSAIILASPVSKKKNVIGVG
jgi:4-hydroxybenzoate polyprenyltransferase